jgi:transcriptional regulator with XRE-family HTH domain
VDKTATPEAHKSRVGSETLYYFLGRPENGRPRSPVAEIVPSKTWVFGGSLTADGKVFLTVGSASYNTSMPPRSLEIGPAGKGVARAIVRARAARGYSQRQLATRVTALGRPMTVTALSRVERMVRRCDIDDFIAIATALGASPHTLLADLPATGNQSERAEHTRRSPVTETGDPPHH